MDVVEKYINLSSGKILLIVDNLFSLSEQRHFKTFVENSVYKLGSVSSLHTELFKKNETWFRSWYSDDEVERFGIMKVLIERYPKYFNDRRISNNWVNATFPGNTLAYHCDHDDILAVPEKLEDADIITVLYYCNLKWDYDDGGETIFCDDTGEPEIAVGFKPNRLLIFDSTIPHRSGMHKQNPNSPRFTFTAGMPKKWLMS